MGRPGRAGRPRLARRLTLDTVAALRAGGCVFAEDEAAILVATAGDEDELTALVARRVAGEPLEHVVGWADFDGLRVQVGPGVFVPRRRTEALARQAVGVTPVGGVVVELCCGAAAVSASIAAAVPTATIHAVDSDPVAVPFARRNIGHARATVHEGDLYSPLPHDLRGSVDVIVANAPYVPTDRLDLLPTEARRHEPLGSLDGGPDGTSIQRRIALGAPEWLAPQGILLIETGRDQRELTARHMRDAGLAVTIVTDDDLEATVVIGRRRRPDPPPRPDQQLAGRFRAAMSSGRCNVLGYAVC